MSTTSDRTLVPAMSDAPGDVRTVPGTHAVRRLDSLTRDVVHGRDDQMLFATDNERWPEGYETTAAHENESHDQTIQRTTQSLQVVWHYNRRSHVEINALLENIKREAESASTSIDAAETNGDIASALATTRTQLANIARLADQSINELAGDSEEQQRDVITAVRDLTAVRDELDAGRV